MTISAESVRKLRETTGAGMLDCRNALQQVQGDFEKAVEFLRKKGAADASKKAGRIAAEGLIYSYIHGEGRIGVLVEVNCETDFVSRNENFKEFIKNVAMQIAAVNPQYVSEAEVPSTILEKEKEIYKEQAKTTGKPAAVIDKIIEGKIQKFYDEVCLLKQTYIKDPDKKISDLLKELIVQVGENCRVRRFVRFQLGEGIEKRKEDFATEVANQVKSR